MAQPQVDDFPGLDLAVAQVQGRPPGPPAPASQPTAAPAAALSPAAPAQAQGTTDGAFPGLDGAIAEAQGQQRAQTAAGVRNSLQFATGASPDAEAKVRHLARFLGQPVETVRADPAAAQSSAVLLATDADRMAAEQPQTAKALSDPSTARMIHDDIPGTQAVEEATRAVGALPRPGLLGDLWTGTRSTALKILGAWDRAAVALSDALPDGALAKMTPEERAFYAGRAEFMTTEGLQNLPQRWTGQITSGMTYAPFMVAAPLVAGGSEGAARTQQLENEGVEPTTAQEAGVAEGGLQALVQLLPLGHLVVGQGAGALAKSTLAAGGKAFAAGAAQSVTSGEIASQLLQANGYQSLAERYAPSLQEAIDSGLFMGALHLGTSAAHAAVARSLQGIADQQVKGDQADEAQQALQTLSAAAAASKFRARDQEAFQDFVAGAGGGDLYVDAKAFAQALDAAGVTGEQFAKQLPEVAAQMREGLQTEGMVRIPVEDYAAKIAGSEVDQQLLPHLRTDPTGMTFDEAQKAQAAQAEAMAQDAAQIASGEPADAAAAREAAFRASADQVEERIREQLDAANRFPASVNAAYAQLHRAFFEAQARREGLLPADVLAQHPVRIGNEAPEAAPGVGLAQLAAGTALQRWQRSLDESRTNTQRVPTLDTPTVLREMGVKERQLTMPRRYYDTVRAEHPDVPEDVVRRLPELMSQPRFVYPHPEGGLSVVLDARTASGAPIVAGVREGRIRTITPQEGGDERLARQIAAVDPKAKVYAGNAEAPAEAGASSAAGALSNPVGLLARSRRNVLTREALVKRYGEQFYQGETVRRGGFDPEQLAIGLTEHADLSTFLHESGHFFLDTLLKRAAGAPGDSPLRADAETILKWFDPHGTTDLARWQSMTLDEQRPFHEQFARGFEAYLMEGHAPSSGLRAVFQRFRAWLVQVYRSAAGLRVNLSDDVRQVMDRLLASDDAIREQEAVRGMTGMFHVKPEGMSDEDFARYQALSEQAHEAGAAKLQDASIRDMKWMSNAKSRALRDLQRQADVLRAGVRDEVTQEVDGMPAFRAKAYLDRETDPNRAHKEALADWRAQRDAVPAAERDAWVDQHPAPERPPSELDAWNEQRAAVEKQVREAERAKIGGKGIERGQALAKAKRKIDNEVERQMLDWELANPRPKAPERAKVDLDLTAEKFGFNSADEMLQAIRDAGDRQDVIRAMTDQRMLERHGELTDPQAIERMAEAAIHNEVRARVIATEMRALAKATGSPSLLARAAREAADAAIAAKRVRDLRPDQYTVAEGKAARASEAAFRKGDIQTAAVQKRAQLLSNALAKAALDARDEVAAGVAYLKKFNKDSILSNLEMDVRAQIERLLGAYDIRSSVSKASLDYKQTLREWVESQQAKGLEPNIPEELIEHAQRLNYQELTVEQFRGLVEAVKTLEHIGRERQQMLDGDRKRALRDLVDEASRQMAGLPGRDPTSNRGLSAIDKKWLGAKSAVSSLDASLLKMEQLIDWLDNENPNGVFNRVVFRRISDAGVVENDLRTEIIGKLQQLKAPPDLDKKLVLAGLVDSRTNTNQVLLKRELIAAALNTGNESNYQKLLAGEGGWTERGLQRAFREHMTKEDWDFVQGVWDTVESLWPRIEAMERRLGNTVPEKIVARPVVTPHGTYRGGYYPMVYDPLRSFDVEQNRQRSTGGDHLFENNYQKATTNQGHTKERAEGYARPVLLSLDVIPRHLSQVIHDLAYREAVIDADRFLMEEDVRAGVERVLGREYYQQFRPWLQSIANDKVYDSRGLAFWDQAAHWARTSTTMVGLGFRVTTMMVHGATAASNSAGEVGLFRFLREVPDGLKAAAAELTPEWLASGARAAGLGRGIDAMAAARDFVFDRSGEMRHRMGEVDRDIRDQLREMETQSMTGLSGGAARAMRLVNGARRTAFYGIAMLDMASALPTWMGAYNKALHEGMAESEAVYAADKAVRNAHGGTGVKDLAAIQRGSEFQKLFTMFYSFWNHFYNRQRAMVRTASELPGKVQAGDFAGARRDFAMVLARSWFYFVIPSLVHAVLKPPPPGSQDEGEHWGVWAAREMAMNLFAGIPVVRNLAETIGAGRDLADILPPLSIAKNVGQTAKDAYGAATGDGASDRWIAHAMQTAGYVFGLPLGQPGATAQFLWDVGEGRQSPQDLADWWSGIVHGQIQH